MREVRLLLCDGAGELLGALPAFQVGTPWWPDVAPVAGGARERYGVEVVVLRLLRVTTRSATMGGSVSYLAEVLSGAAAVLSPDGAALPGDGAALPGDGAVRSADSACAAGAATSWRRFVRAVPDGDPDAQAAATDSPLRAPWARPGGVAAMVTWADAALAAAGRPPRTGPAVQVKSWNLSCLVRLPTETGAVWCKRVPPFMAHEGAAIASVGARFPDLVPELVATEPASGTVLLGEVPGSDRVDAEERQVMAMLRTLVEVQAGLAGQAAALLAAGLNDLRGVTLPARLAALLARPEALTGLSDVERGGLHEFAARLPARLAALQECGLPETLVHGDPQPLNWRGEPDAGAAGLRLLDWGDSGVGHPALDRGSFVSRGSAAATSRLAAAWESTWRERVPGSDPARAAELATPISCLKAALVYRRFLDRIEPTEHPYHCDDVPLWLRRTLDAVGRRMP